MLTVELTNRTAKFLEPFHPARIRGYFEFRIKNYFFHPKYRQKWVGRDGVEHPLWDGYINLLRKSTVNAGLFLLREREIGEKYDLRVVDKRIFPQFKPAVPNPRIKDWDFQSQCVEAMIGDSRTGGLVLNATGSGKTTIAAMLFERLVGTAVFLVDEVTLLYQTRDELARILGEEIGVIGNQEFDPRRITVATVQTIHLHRSDKKFRPWQKDLAVMIVDEVHLALNKRQFDTIHKIQPLAVYGLTATLQIQHDYIQFPAASLCGPVIYTYPYETGMQEDILAPGAVVGVDILRVQSTRMPWPQVYKMDIVHSPLRNRIVTDLVAEGLKREYRIVVLVDRVAHLKNISDRLAKLGIDHRKVHGSVKVSERQKAVKDFEAGTLRVIVTNKVFKKGINIKRVTALVDAAAGVDPSDAQQKFGRGARKSPGKKGFLYFDLGERKPKGAHGTNRFKVGTKARRLSLANLGVPVITIRAKEGAAAAFNAGEKALDSLLEKLKQAAGFKRAKGAK